MFRRRGTGGGREGDIGLADVAVAVLGPVAFLWIVFQAFAAINSERQCEELSVIEVSERAQLLKEWYAGQQRELAILDEAARVSCGARTSFPISVPPPSEIIPETLLKVCAKDRSNVLKGAGLPDDSLARLAAERAARDTALAACTKGDGLCPTLATPAERQRRLKDLRTWYEGRRKLLTAAEAALARDCPQLKTDSARARSDALSVPPPLTDLCAPERAALIAALGVGQGDIDHQEQRIDAALTVHLACAPSIAQTGCRTLQELKPEERSKARADVIAWYRDLRERALADEQLLKEKQCPAAVTPATYSRVIEPLRQHKVCDAADAFLIADAGLKADAIDQLLAHRARLDAALRACIGLRAEVGCQWFDQARLATAGRDLRNWYDAYRDRVEEDHRLAERYCDRPAGPAPQIEPMPAPIFKSSKVCREQWPSLMRVAQVTESSIDALQVRHAAILDRLRSCVVNETATQIERSIRFIACRADFTLDDKSQLKMPRKEMEDRFDEIAKRVLKELDNAASPYNKQVDKPARPYNRIEVRGHTDGTPISGSCMGATTNAQLSSLRAHKFNEELLNAIERLALSDAPAADAAGRMLSRLDSHIQELNRRANPPPRRIVADPPAPTGLFAQPDPADQPRLAEQRAAEKRLTEQKNLAMRLLRRIAPFQAGAVPLRLYAIGVGPDEPAYKTLAEYPRCEAGITREQCKNLYDRRIEFRFVREAGRD